jgi:hypothetical protein
MRAAIAFKPTRAALLRNGIQLVEHARGHHATDKHVFLAIKPRTDPR